MRKIYMWVKNPQIILFWREWKPLFWVAVITDKGGPRSDFCGVNANIFS